MSKIYTIIININHTKILTKGNRIPLIFFFFNSNIIFVKYTICEYLESRFWMFSSNKYWNRYFNNRMWWKFDKFCVNFGSFFRGFEKLVVEIKNKIVKPASLGIKNVYYERKAFLLLMVFLNVYLFTQKSWTFFFIRYKFKNFPALNL